MSVQSEKACAVCGTLFIPARWNQVCCSSECRYARFNQQNRESRQRAWASAHGLETRQAPSAPRSPAPTDQRDPASLRAQADALVRQAKLAEETAKAWADEGRAGAEVVLSDARETFGPDRAAVYRDLLREAVTCEVRARLARARIWELVQAWDAEFDARPPVVAPGQPASPADPSAPSLAA
jgi:predicted nucleic acid-binding Zn ribbon protein